MATLWFQQYTRERVFEFLKINTGSVYLVGKNADSPLNAAGFFSAGG